MLTLIRAGGYPMFFILVFGFAGLAGAGWYAFRPNPRNLGFVTWIGVSVLFSTLQGTCSDLGMVFSHVTRMPEGIPSVPVLLEGLAESTSPGILGFTFLALMALVTAVGRARDLRAAPRA